MRKAFYRRPWAATALYMGLLVAAFTHHSAQAEGLSAYRGRNRVLLVFAPTRGDARYQHQVAFLRGETGGMTDRNLILRYEGDDASAERRRFHVARRQFRVILIGKDGHAATSADYPLPARTLFGLIDAMPMRRDEIHRHQRR